MYATTYLTEAMAIDQYDEILDMDGPVLVGGLEFLPSRIIRELDPVAYRCGMADYMDDCDQEIVDDNDPRLDEELDMGE